MNRMRTALLASIAVLAVPGLAACSAGSGGGTTVHTGAAAVVGTQRITEAALQGQVSSFRAVAPAQAQGQPGTSGATYGQDSPGMPDHVLQFLINARVVQAALDQQGITVLGSDVDKAQAPDLARAGSRAALGAEFAAQLGLPPEDMDAWYRTQVGELQLLNAAGVSPTSQQAVPLLTKLFSDTAKAQGVRVNPRYGSGWAPFALNLPAPKQLWIKQS